MDDSNWFFGNQDAYTKTDLSVAWMSVNQDWTARFWVTNLEDEATLLKATRFGGDVAVTGLRQPAYVGPDRRLPLLDRIILAERPGSAMAEPGLFYGA